MAPFVIDEITLVGSRCGPFDLALQAIEQEMLELDSTITGRFPLEQAELAFAAATSPEHGKILLDPAGC